MNKNDKDSNKPLTKKDWLHYARSKQTPETDCFDNEFSRRALKGLQYVQNEREARRALSNLENRVAKATQPQNRRFPLWLRLAAAVLLFLIPASVLWLDIDNGPAANHTFAHHFEPIPSAIPLSGGLRAEEAALNLKKSALLEYENKIYGSANEKFNRYLKASPDDHPVRFYYGISLLADDRPEAAIRELEVVSRQKKHNQYHYPAIWYLSLAHLKTNQTGIAEKYLGMLAEQTQSPHYQKKAEQLLKEID